MNNTGENPLTIFYQELPDLKVKGAPFFKRGKQLTLLKVTLWTVLSLTSSRFRVIYFLQVNLQAGNSVADPGFPVGENSQGGCANLLFC